MPMEPKDPKLKALSFQSELGSLSHIDMGTGSQHDAPGGAFAGVEGRERPGNPLAPIIVDLGEFTLIVQKVQFLETKG